MSDLTELDIECLKTYADSSMNQLEASRRIHVHTNTIWYHLDRIKQKTGLNPHNFYDLVKLMRMIGEDI